jgi:transcriptional regulator NrdR family protein
MKCPVCGSKTHVIEKRNPDLHCTTHRVRECLECLTRFKTSEKVIFSSLPKYIRDKFLDEGKRK